MSLPATPNQKQVAQALNMTPGRLSQLLHDQDSERGRRLRRCRIPSEPHRFDKRLLIKEGLVDEQPSNDELNSLRQRVAELEAWRKSITEAIGGVASTE